MKIFIGIFQFSLSKRKVLKRRDDEMKSWSVFVCISRKLWFESSDTLLNKKKKRKRKRNKARDSRRMYMRTCVMYIYGMCCARRKSDFFFFISSNWKAPRREASRAFSNSIRAYTVDNSSEKKHSSFLFFVTKVPFIFIYLI